MLIIGLTGGIGSGKTEVARIFAALGVPVIDTDTIAHKLTEVNSPILQKLIDHFGTEILTEKNLLDRKRLSQFIFNNDAERKILEGILHPAIEIEVRRQLAALSETGTAYVIVVVPLLFETSFKTMVDKTLVIDSTEEDQIARTRKRDGRDDADIQKIMQQQLPRELRLKYADDILSNSGSLEALNMAVQQLHQRYLSTDTL